MKLGRRVTGTDSGDPRAPRLHLRAAPRGREVFTRALGEPPSVRGEPVRSVDGEPFRRWEPQRSKLGAAVVLGWERPMPGEGERWLYLGAGSGTTASHLADLLGPSGAVYAVEPSLRPFLGLIEVAERYPNLLPIRGDARRPELYEGSVPPVDGLYADVAQADQPEIVSANLRWFVRPGGKLLFVVKTSSMGRERSAATLLDRALARLPDGLVDRTTRPLEPFHRRHFLLGGRWDPAGAGAGPASRTRGPRRPRGRPARRRP